MKIAFLLGALALACSCGGSNPNPTGYTYSCSWKDSSGASGGTCIYYAISTASPNTKAQVEQVCTGSGGVYGESLCPSVDQFGRCIQFEGAPGEVSVFYYASYAGGVADAKSACSAIPGRWEDLP